MRTFRLDRGQYDLRDFNFASGLNQVEDETRERSQLSLQWLEDDHCARMIIDPGMTVLWANKRAIDLAGESIQFSADR